MEARNELEAFAEMDDTAHIETSTLRRVRQAFHESRPQVLPFPSPERRFGIDGPYRRGPRSYRPLLAWVGVSAAAVVAAVVWAL